MGICACCGNEYKKTFRVIFANKRYTFDCFECVIQHLAPICQHCGCKVIGHGVEANDSIFCCNHCLKTAITNANAKMPMLPTEAQIIYK
jgi:hypothetical protein